MLRTVVFLWFVLMIPSLLLVPFRCLYMWYEAGGRVWLTTQSPYFVYVAPDPRWSTARHLRSGTAGGGAGDDERTDTATTIARSRVLKLPTTTYRRDTTTSDVEMATDTCCSICLDDFKTGETLRLLPCGHSFHTDCVLPWLTERQGRCPLCKTPAVDEGNDERRRVDATTVVVADRSNYTNNGRPRMADLFY